MKDQSVLRSNWTTFRVSSGKHHSNLVKHICGTPLQCNGLMQHLLHT